MKRPKETTEQVKNNGYTILVQNKIWTTASRW